MRHRRIFLGIRPVLSRLVAGLAMVLCLGVSTPASANWFSAYGSAPGSPTMDSACHAMFDYLVAHTPSGSTTHYATYKTFGSPIWVCSSYAVNNSDSTPATTYSNPTGSTSYDLFRTCPSGQTADTSLKEPSGCIPTNSSMSTETHGNACPGCSAEKGQPNMTPASASSGLSQPSVGVKGIGEPIDVQSGNVFYHVTDYESAGINKLSFARFYNSLEGDQSYAKSLGQSWRHTYDRYISNNGYGYLERADGKRIPLSISGWALNGGNYYDYKGSYADAGTVRTFTLITPEDTVEVYVGTTASGAIAQLQSITYRNGYTQTLDRTLANTLKVTDSYGRVLTLNYSAGLLQSVNTPDGTTISYGYPLTKIGDSEQIPFSESEIKQIIVTHK